MDQDFSKLSRERYPIPEYVKEALAQSELQSEFNGRPAFQQNDYVGWISRAKREATRQKRLAQMLHELTIGGVYMGMDHPASRR